MQLKVRPIVARILRFARVIALGVRAWSVRTHGAQLEAPERFLEKRNSWSRSKWKGELRRAPTRCAGHAATGTSSRDSAPPRKKSIADTSISSARFIFQWVSARSTKTGDWRASGRWKKSRGFCERTCPGAAWDLSARNSFENSKQKRPFFQ